MKSSRINPMTPSPHPVLSITRETAAEYTFRVKYTGQIRHGQFFMLSIPLFGEAPISVSGQGDGWIEFTIRKVGKLTGGVFGLQPRELLFMRGPYGNGFPIEDFMGKDLIVITGGTGMAPVRSMLRYFHTHPGEARSIHLIAGFKDPSCVLFREDLEDFKRTFHAVYTLDAVEAEGFETGLVTEFIKEIPFETFADYNVAIVGPPVMMHFAGKECLACGAEEDKIWMSFERKMSCAIGKCGHCKINETYVCLEGPVFPYTKAKKLID